MFALCFMSSEAGQHCSVRLCTSLCPCEDIAFREKRDERHPAALSRSRARRALICWRFVRGMKGRRGAAWPNPPLVTKVSQHVLRGLWRNLAPLSLSYAHLSTFPASAGLATVFMTVFMCVCVAAGVCACLCVYQVQCLALLGLWIPCSPVRRAMLCVILKPEI